MENREAMTITCMHPDSYNAAAKGSISYFKDHSSEGTLDLEGLLTPNKNTVLHIFIKTLENRSESTDQNNFVGDILILCPTLLCQVNDKDETPIHVAARHGHANIVEVLIQRAKYLHQDLGSGNKTVRKMLRMVTKEKDTALHEAVRYKHEDVINLLIKEEPGLSNFVNDAGETPLYIAAERNYEDLVSKILNTCNSAAYDGPLGRTALHAAVIQNSEGSIKEILEKIVGIITRTDQEGWTPLHLAAYLGNCEPTKLLLKHDPQVAYMKDKKGRTALHIAVHRGNEKVMESIIGMCPDCCELVDNRGWNALHFAVDGNLSVWKMEVILENSSLSNLLNEKDAEGNTPLHHHSCSSGPYLKKLIDHPRVDRMAFNNKNLNAYQVALTSTAKLSEGKMKKIEAKHWFYSGRVFTEEEEIVKKTREDKMKKDMENEWKDMENEWKARRKQYLEKAAETHLVVAALITTLTFAAVITMPGGFVGSGDDPHEHEGSILKRNVAFKMFMITDAISLVLSSSAVVTHLLMPLLFKYSESDETHIAFLRLAYGFILTAMAAMVLAFITGAYAVLAHSLDLAVITCVIGSSFFVIITLICGLFRKDLGLLYVVSNIVDKVEDLFGWCS